MFEKKNGKRFLASVMALVMLLSLAPVGALAADDEPLTNGECSAMPLPAVEGKDQQAVMDTPKEDTPTPQPAVDPKPVVDTPENGETTNSDAENGVANLPLLDENRPVVDMDMPQEVKPLDDLFNDVLGVEPEQESFNTFAAPTKTQKIKASFFYLKTPTSNPESNKNSDWGSKLGEGEVEISGNLRWNPTNTPGTYGNVQNTFDVNNDMITSWPSTNGTYSEESDGYILLTNSTHWTTVFNAYKNSVEEKLKKNITKEDIDEIILKPFKISKYNITDGSYHVDCTVEVKCKSFATATFYLWDDTMGMYTQYRAANYEVGNTVTFPDVDVKDKYVFSGWYLDNELTESARSSYPITKNVSFYGRYLEDKIGKGENKDQPDGIPDKYQVTVNYVSADTSKGTVGTPTKEVLTIYKAGSTTEWAETGTVEASGSIATANDKYRFVNWINNAGVDTDEAGAELGEQTINATGGNTYTFTANFEVQPEPETYTVIFNANGGSWADAATQKTQTYTEKSVTVTSPANPEQNGYSFKGWVYRDADGKDQEITPLLLMGASVSKLMSLPTVSDNTITLYAKWEEAPKAQVTYTINKHYIRSETDTDNIEITGLSSKKGTEISKLIEGEAKNKDWRGNHYFYDSEKTTGSTKSPSRCSMVSGITRPP